MSHWGKKMIGNDIHFHLERHIVVQTEVLQSQTTGIKTMFEVINTYFEMGHPPSCLWIAS